MTLPDHDRCAQVLKDLQGDPALTQWESDFIDSNRGRTTFTDKQKEVIAGFMDKYEV